MIAFLFAGQGVEPPWVAADVLAAPEVAALVACASQACGHDVARLLARGGRELARSEVVQPAMVAVGLGLVELLARAGVRPAIVLGHSLGELTAWAAAGAIGAEDAIGVAALRGRLMAREAARRPGGMVRLTGDAEDCARALAIGGAAGAICVGAHNAVDEWALTGDDAALAAVIARFKAVRLAQAGAWHSPAMAGAVDELSAAIARLPRRPLRARFVANRDGALTADAEVPARLAGQLVQPVRWRTSLETAVAAGVTRWLAIGPGKMLRALLRRNLGEARDVEIIDCVAAIAAAARSAHAVA